MSEIQTKEMIRRRKRKHAAAVAIFGMILAFVCRALPPEYHGPCETIIRVCSGGL